jgi:ABC-type polysaccharide/polyol phosphate export permease
MYDASIYPAGLRWLAIVNPIAVTIEAMRAALFCHVWPNGALIAAQFLAGSIALGLSVLYMRRVEDRLVDVL